MTHRYAYHLTTAAALLAVAACSSRDRRATADSTGAATTPSATPSGSAGASTGAAAGTMGGAAGQMRDTGMQHNMR
ncbi:MAG: hypothetical protein ACJ79S_12820, partial [Gemmatimonadaceae bacterium]